MVSMAFKYVPQPTATTFAFSSVFILRETYLWHVVGGGGEDQLAGLRVQYVLEGVLTVHQHKQQRLYKMDVRVCKPTYIVYYNKLKKIVAHRCNNCVQYILTANI